MTAIVENNPTRRLARPAVIIANVRTGGTFLAHCLSNHPQIYCDRDEPLHATGIWRRVFGIIRPHVILSIILHQEGYLASMCKLQYGQSRYFGVWDYLMRCKAKVIHVIRENALRQTISLMINKHVRSGQIDFHPQQSFVLAGQPIKISLKPDSVLKHIGDIVKADAEMTQRIVDSGLPHMQLTYADIVGGEGIQAHCIPDATEERLCKFLAVAPCPLYSELRRINPYPLAEMLENWEEIEAAIVNGPFAYCLKDEEIWERQ